MELRISDGNGNLQWPVDPRTGKAMTEAAWRRYMAEFMEQIRARAPGRRDRPQLALVRR